MSEELVTGIHAVAAVLEHNPGRIVQLYISNKSRNSRLDPLLQSAAQQQITIHEVTRDKLDRLAGEYRHQGIIARCQPNQKRGDSELVWDIKALSEPAMLLVLDGVQDPHNLGACIRTLNGAGGHGVVLPKDRAAPVTPVVHKSASGAMETTPLYHVTNLARSLQNLKDETGIWIYGTSDKADKSLYDLDMTVPFALVLGTEGKGVRRLVAEQCDQLVSIPMLGSVSSLNVSVATGVCCYEALRQRKLNKTQ
ncbi:MAG TPA: 23S rRNA (guanosine(2251)-2'-O)-methyltransferase RlmB [Gammaproteobacteria bacterium]|nr:23S rRNA (guanosine(2251)-2'-O)-methyltransferase RlmB [Gammaproteobacteria bacterium]